jgi:GntR family transcriptional regulator
MFLTLTDLSSESLQSQIARQVRAKVLAGELAAGGGLPSIRALARQLHISVITVQRAYETLEREGLIHSRRGKGFFVSELSQDQKTEMARHRLRELLAPQIDAARAEGLSVDDISDIVARLLKNDASGK